MLSAFDRVMGVWESPISDVGLFHWVSGSGPLGRSVRGSGRVLSTDRAVEQQVPLVFPGPSGG